MESGISPFSKSQHLGDSSNKRNLTSSYDKDNNEFGKSLVSHTSDYEPSFKRNIPINPASHSRDYSQSISSSQQLHFHGPNQNMLTMSYEKNNANSNNTLSLSGLNSGTTNMHSYCKNCKRMEENERMLIHELNEMINSFSDILDKEKLWRQGKLNFGYENFGILLV